MSNSKPEVIIYSSHDAFCEKVGLPKPHRVEFDRSRVNQSKLKVIKSYFTDLCTDLTLYSDLYANKNSIDVLNKFNSLVFHRIQKAYIEKICLSIACLLDPEQTGKNKNLSLEHIIKQCNCPELDEKLSKLQDTYSTTGIKDWRNKLLAHNDLRTLMGEEKLNLKFEHDDIENILKLIQDIFDDISDPTVHTDIRIVFPFDMTGSAFVIKLQNALDNFNYRLKKSDS